MLVRGLRIRLLRELSRTLQGWSDLVQQQLDRVVDAAPVPAPPAADNWPRVAGPGDPAEDTLSPDAAAGTVPDSPPAHWLVRARSAGPPADWQQRVAQAGSAPPSAPVPAESASAPADTVPLAPPSPSGPELHTPERVESAPPRKKVGAVPSQRLGINRTIFTRAAIKFAEKAEHRLFYGRGSPLRPNVGAVFNRTIFAGAALKWAEKVGHKLFHGRGSPPRTDVGTVFNRTIFTAEHKEDPESTAKKQYASPAATDMAPAGKPAQQDARAQPQASRISSGPPKLRAGLYQPFRPTGKQKRSAFASGDAPLLAERATSEPQASLAKTGWGQSIRLQLPRISQPPARKNPIPAMRDLASAGKKMAEVTKSAADQVARIALRPPPQFVLQDEPTPARFGVPVNSVRQVAPGAAREDASPRQALVQPALSQFVRPPAPSYGWDQIHAEYPQPETAWPMLPSDLSLTTPAPGFEQGELRPGYEDAAEDGAAILRRWERQRRLDEEQRRL
ncbi:MAG: hypothetical protein EXR62_09005 [Chloroflexi bacterium]|nr:hypothetical protein [Chloroflexota bacterium]